MACAYDNMLLNHDQQWSQQTFICSFTVVSDAQGFFNPHGYMGKGQKGKGWGQDFLTP